MTAIRLAFMCVVLLSSTGCRYYKRVPLTVTQPSGERVWLSHTEICVGDDDAIEVRLEPARAATWSLFDSKHVPVRTGHLSSSMLVDVKRLPAMTYTLRVTPDSGPSLEAHFEMHQCAYW